MQQSLSRWRSNPKSQVESTRKDLTTAGLLRYDWNAVDWWNKVIAEWINSDMSNKLYCFTSDLSAMHVHWSWNELKNWNCYLFFAGLLFFLVKYIFLKLRRTCFGEWTITASHKPYPVKSHSWFVYLLFFGSTRILFCKNDQILENMLKRHPELSFQYKASICSQMKNACIL